MTFSRRWLMLVIALGATACLSPTLPLPPPSAPDYTAPDQDGNVTLTGTASNDAEVFSFNDRTQSGAIATADGNGSYTMKLAAKLGDDIEVWQEVGNDRSPTVVITIKPK